MIRTEYEEWQDELSGKRRVNWRLIAGVAFCAIVWGAVIITVVRR